MSASYSIHCTCGQVALTLQGKPIVHAVCHCTDCRELLGIPFHAVTAWKEEQVTVNSGADAIKVYQHPTLNMQKHYCETCGDVLFNTNGMNWRVVSQFLIARCHGGTLPEALHSTRHFFYEQRVTTIDDELPKYLRGTDGPLFEG